MKKLFFAFLCLSSITPSIIHACSLPDTVKPLEDNLTTIKKLLNENYLVKKAKDLVCQGADQTKIDSPAKIKTTNAPS